MTKIKAILSQTKTAYASDDYFSNDVTIQYHDSPVQGRLIAARFKESNILSITTGDYEDEVKFKLAEFLAKKMIEDKLISFTKKVDPTSYTNEYIATVHLTPDSHVRLIRIAMGQIKPKPEDLK